MSNTTKCRACGAPIRFIRLQNGKTMPVDAEPHKFIHYLDGEAIFVTEDGEVKRGDYADDITATEDMLSTGYISHFATCPGASTFRKPRKKDRKKARNENQDA